MGKPIQIIHKVKPYETKIQIQITKLKISSVRGFEPRPFRTWGKCANHYNTLPPGWARNFLYLAYLTYLEQKRYLTIFLNY